MSEKEMGYTKQEEKCTAFLREWKRPFLSQRANSTTCAFFLVVSHQRVLRFFDINKKSFLDAMKDLAKICLDQGSLL